MNKELEEAIKVLKKISRDDLLNCWEGGENVYKKHFIYLNENTLYVVEDVSGAYVDKFHYEVNYIPEMIVPFTFISED